MFNELNSFEINILIKLITTADISLRLFTMNGHETEEVVSRGLVIISLLLLEYVIVNVTDVHRQEMQFEVVAAFRICLNYLHVSSVGLKKDKLS